MLYCNLVESGGVTVYEDFSVPQLTYNGAYEKAKEELQGVPNYKAKMSTTGILLIKDSHGNQLTCECPGLPRCIFT